jgi:hypothetical protein
LGLSVRRHDTFTELGWGAIQIRGKGQACDDLIADRRSRIEPPAAPGEAGKQQSDGDDFEGRGVHAKEIKFNDARA